MQKPTIEIIKKFYCNNCTGSEREQVLNYLATLSFKEQNKFLDKHLASYTNEKNECAVTDGFDGILEKISLIKKTNFNRRGYFYSIAASIAFLLIISISITYFIHNNSNTESTNIRWSSKETKLGQKSIITLLDGTRITLNSDSKLVYPSKFGEINREVYLTGEAFFEVAHISDTPFIVHSDNSSITVLGTKFNVKSFPQDDEVLVSLVEGSVEVSNSSQFSGASTKLKKGQQIKINKVSGSENVSSFDPLEVTGWKDNFLVFKNVPIREVFESLSRTYGVQFELKEIEHINKRITINFDNESFWATVKVIKKITKLDYFTTEKDNQLHKIIFSSRKM